MAAGEHHPQLLVPDRGGGKRLVHRRRERPFRLENRASSGANIRAVRWRRTMSSARLRANGHQPARGVLRHATDLPHIEGAAEGVLDDVFCQRQVVDTKDPRQRRDQAAGLPTKQVLAEIH
jgi:hypothetical protein